MSRLLEIDRVLIVEIKITNNQPVLTTSSFRKVSSPLPHIYILVGIKYILLAEESNNLSRYEEKVRGTRTRVFKVRREKIAKRLDTEQTRTLARTFQDC